MTGGASAKTWQRQIVPGRPTVFTIPARVAFVDALAAGLLADADDDPLALAAVTVLLPTRRAARSLREAFLRLTDGRPLLLPRMMPLNDVDSDETLFGSYATGIETDIPPAIAPLHRQMLLARLITAAGDTRPEQALQLAAELARLLDQVQTERLAFSELKALVPDDYAAHWQITLKFLEIVTAEWPKILDQEGAIDPAAHRNAVFAAQAMIWAAGRSGPVVAAGSTGSVPATADLLAVIARMPNGCVVLPGLDQILDDPAWEAVSDTHPQFGLKQLLKRIDLPRERVALWPGVGMATPSPRERLVSEVMRPAATTDVWMVPGGPLTTLDRDAVDGLTVLACPAPREEAETIALIMREAIQHESRTCALVTPDRTLAQRVAAALERWDIAIDDSAGRPLHRTPPGAFLRLTADMVAGGFAPVATLAVCKHPLAAAGRDPVAFRELTRAAELHLLRGPRPPEGLDGLARLAARSENADARTWLALLTGAAQAFAGLMHAGPQPLRTLLTAHMEMAEALAAAKDTPGPMRLWAGDDGEAAAAFVAEVTRSADLLPPIAPAAYPAVLETLMSGRVVRPHYGRHPRLAILGPLEARLQRWDVLILGGLNAGTWPAEPAPDPWMSRPMREKFGLPSAERRIGLAAHDIAQALSAPRVVLTRSLKVDGAPTVPSRWLMRLERVISAAGLSSALVDETGTWPVWARLLTRPEQIIPWDAPAPAPPVAARPRRLSVTDVERWMRDPYSIYARYVLQLKPIDPLEQDPGAAEYGQLIHRALQNFVAEFPRGTLPEDGLARLIAHGEKVFAREALRPGIAAFWWPRFTRIAAWFIATETERRDSLVRAWVEKKGEIVLKGPAGPFTLHGRADRIDEMRHGIALIDYKTGAPPRSKEVLAGYAPQLPLEAVMIAAGGFDDVPRKPVAELSFWQLHGRADGGRVEVVKGDPADIATAARDGLTQLIATFDRPDTRYEARPNPDTAPAYSDYLHLARVKEWGAVPGDDG